MTESQIVKSNPKTLLLPSLLRMFQLPNLRFVPMTRLLIRLMHLTVVGCEYVAPKPLSLEKKFSSLSWFNWEVRMNSMFDFCFNLEKRDNKDDDDSFLKLKDFSFWVILHFFSSRNHFVNDTGLFFKVDYKSAVRFLFAELCARVHDIKPTVN